MPRLHPQELQYQAEQLWSGQQLTVLLCTDDPGLTDVSSLGDWLENELLTTNGYNRAQFTIASAGSYDSPNREQDLPQGAATFSGSGSGFTYRTAITVRGGSTRSLIGTITDASVNTTTNRLTITGHGSVSGEALVLHPLFGDTLPSPLAAGTIYYSAPFDANTISLFADSGLVSGVDLTTTGTGSFRVRNASGTVVSIDISPSDRTIAAGSVEAYQLSISQVAPA